MHVLVLKLVIPNSSYRVSKLATYILVLPNFVINTAYLKSVLPVVVMVMVLEVVVDSIKHAFITKFNDISPDVYRKYRTILAMDLVTCRQDTVSELSTTLLCGIIIYFCVVSYVNYSLE